MSFIESLFNLSGKTAVVTGTSRGIGYNCAEMLEKCGCRVIGIARTAPKTAASFKHLCCDLSLENDVKRVIEEIYSKLDKVDILVNAAGITNPAVNDTSTHPEIDIFTQTLDLNLVAAFRLSSLLIPGMKEYRSGSIINITSIGAEFGFPGNPGYVASKGGLKMLSKAMANDLAEFGIRVNNLAPGYIKTDMTQKSFEDGNLYEQRLRNMLIPRWGTPEDIAKAVVFLASDASGYITGIDLLVDGGWAAKGMV